MTTNDKGRKYIFDDQYRLVSVETDVSEISRFGYYADSFLSDHDVPCPECGRRCSQSYVY
jgi:hypothetical protein